MLLRVGLALAMAACLVLPQRHANAVVTDGSDQPPKLLIYFAKGAPDSCGQGCDRWIAVEGRVDREAAQRVRQFLGRIKGVLPPIYFHSPGGEVTQALPIARLLRERRATARIGRTLASACASGSDIDAACIKIKSESSELDASVTSRGAMCNSACSYIFLGATAREIAPDATMGVHSSKMVVHYRGNPSERMREDFLAAARARSDRDQSSLIRAMGISAELVDLIRTVPYEKHHILTRQELVRFGIDTRDFVETPWMFDTSQRAYLRKAAMLKNSDGSFRKLQWNLFCDSKDRARLVFAREFNKAFLGGPISLGASSDKPVTFGALPSRNGDFEVYSATAKPQTINDWGSARRLTMNEAALTPGGPSSAATFEIATLGFAEAWTRLQMACSLSPGASMMLPVTTPKP